MHNSYIASRIGIRKSRTHLVHLRREIVAPSVAHPTRKAIHGRLASSLGLVTPNTMLSLALTVWQAAESPDAMLMLTLISINPSLMLVVPSLRFGNIFLLGDLSKSSSSYKHVTYWDLRLCRSGKVV